MRNTLAILFQIIGVCLVFLSSAIVVLVSYLHFSYLEMPIFLRRPEIYMLVVSMGLILVGKYLNRQKARTPSPEN